jgi:hypothetical protein
MLGAIVIAWTAASLGAANMQLSSVILAFAGLITAMGAMMMAFALGLRDIQVMSRQ